MKLNILEQNYISVVAVVSDAQNTIERKINDILDVLKKKFQYYELIVVDNMSKDNTLDVMQQMEAKFTYIQLPIKHDSQSALSAGINIAIGDYIVEIEDLNMNIDYGYIIDLYKRCQEGNDFVFLTPTKNSISSHVFYEILNKNLKNFSVSNITSSIMTLSSRRGQYKTSEVGARLVNRNVSYVLTGLQTAAIPYDLDYENRRGFKQNYTLMMQTLLYYTDFVVLTAEKISLFFLCISLFFIGYGIYMKLAANTVDGWASMVVIMSFAFSGLFLMLGLISRYLDNILKNTVKTKEYIYRNVTKK